MNYRDISHWEISNLSDAFIFCIQRLDELLFDYTIDSYKPRALNTPSLCVELINIIDEVENGNIDKNNINYIIEELQDSFKYDFVAKSLIHTNLNYYTSFQEDCSLKELKLKISTLERSLERYRYMREVQRQLVKAVSLKNKDDINNLIRNYVTTFINWGISKQYLYHRTNKFFFDRTKKIEKESQLLEFFEILSPKSHNYSVYFRVSSNILLLKESFNYFKISEVDLEDQEKNAMFKANNFIPKQNDAIIEIKDLKIPDPFVARDIAEKRLETIRNTSHFFYHNSKLKWNKTALVVQQCCKQERIIANNQMNPMRKSYNYKSNEVAKNTNQIFKNIALQGESFNKFNRVLELHSNCLQNLAPENQLINLWIIFETLIPSTNKKSKVSNICDKILPILLLKYFRKLVTNLHEDLLRWNKELLESFIKDIPSEPDTWLAKFVCFLSDKQFRVKRDELFAAMGNYTLLRNRTFKISEAINDKDNVISRLETHRMNVLWQIRRVYRTRNMIIHSGRTPKYLNILIENTHDYIDQILSEIIDMTTSNFRILNLDQAFEFGHILFKEIENKVKESGNCKDYVYALVRENIL